MVKLGRLHLTTGPSLVSLMTRQKINNVFKWEVSFVLPSLVAPFLGKLMAL
jgi:hypothetical protein